MINKLDFIKLKEKHFSSADILGNEEASHRKEYIFKLYT